MLKENKKFVYIYIYITHPRYFDFKGYGKDEISTSTTVNSAYKSIFQTVSEYFPHPEQDAVPTSEGRGTGGGRHCFAVMHRPDAPTLFCCDAPPSDNKSSDKKFFDIRIVFPYLVVNNGVCNIINKTFQTRIKTKNGKVDLSCGPKRSNVQPFEEEEEEESRFVSTLLQKKGTPYGLLEESLFTWNEKSEKFEKWNPPVINEEVSHDSSHDLLAGNSSSRKDGEEKIVHHNIIGQWFNGILGLRNFTPEGGHIGNVVRNAEDNENIAGDMFQKTMRKFIGGRYREFVKGKRVCEG